MVEEEGRIGIMQLDGGKVVWFDLAF